jgi:hypothetical protein
MSSAAAFRRIRHRSQFAPRTGVLTTMGRLFAIIGSTIGGWLGWTIGERVGFMTAYMLGILGTAAGVYYGRLFADRLID